MTIKILGTDYEIIKKQYSEDEIFERRSIDGYCDRYTHQIVYCDMTTYKGWEHEDLATIAESEKQTLRHEVVHAFLSESGLADSSHVYNGAWANNEEMIDWIASQGPKIHTAWVDACAI